MNEKILAEKFSEQIDRLVKGIHPPSKTDADDACKDEIRLVEAILRQDFSAESPIKAELKKGLLDKFKTRKEANPRQQSESFYSDDELSDEELDYAAGGHSLREESACTKCGCKKSRATIAGAICPDCGHARDEHM